MDIEGHFNDPKINAAIEVLKKNTESLDILEFIKHQIIEIKTSPQILLCDFRLTCYISMGDW